MKLAIVLSVFFIFSGCSGGGGNGQNSVSSKTIASPVVDAKVLATQTETQAIIQTLKSNPTYQLSQTELKALDDSKVLSAEDKAFLNSLQVK